MSRKSKKILKPDEEVLQSLVNADGTGEDPAVRAMLSDKFVEGSNVEATQIALALQQIIRGQNSLLSNQDRFAEELNALHRRMDEMDKAAQAWETDRERFIQEQLDKAESLKATGYDKDKILAKGGQMFTDAVAKARAEHSVELVKFEQQLAAMPKVTIVSGGEIAMVMENGQPAVKLMNEVVKIKNHRWVLPVGQPTEVPLVVKQVLDERRRLQEETRAREKLMSANLESSSFAEKWGEINKKYNSTTDTLPSA